MKSIKLSELWANVDAAMEGDRAAGIKYAIVEAHKILEQTLVSKGYPGRTLDRKLYWAGYSLEDNEGLRKALDKYEEVLKSLDFPISDLEAAEVIGLYKKVVHEVANKPSQNFQDKFEAFCKVYLSPKSVYTWRNLAIVFGTLFGVKVLNYTSLGKTIVSNVIYFADLALSWVTIVLIGVIVVAFLVYANLKENKTKIKIKG